ncbi:hypothetical protein CO005_00080 [Candidatus Roizmanbacteria bacterium CG_4_8_14_3_um_filter_34_9]|uniref:Uncharacterized protein n=3 Tax=Candidatus Roizmaniibacteriota TaxID=1752723 RepID=A0A2M7AUV3_9BACT|nr:MAG: hypothetical protein COT02_02920 [Candidatus Roizmanbacteria bacterium CG07_land_8_20_14_0_80_34_15]PIU74388.1 MAG: hypothetical protein COS77_01810 [Candidatus Roizmanbacteria bacterium CG06_land_8_20_14_3_00_34_14]PIW73685.1 MAG: hypothetical protein CO005_00080 [Candidatus Roizmanbacteria bacterium CG_4_8_14_3_um_filter_34_9]
MKKWQRYWLYFVITIFTLHFVRDIFQELGIRNFLSTFFESSGPPKVSLFLYYTLYNTVFMAIIEVAFSIICLRRNKFGVLGKATIIMTISFFILWLIYYFLL